MWNRRELLTAVAGGAAGVGVAGWAQADGQTTDNQHEHHGIMKSCFEACTECAKACNQAFHHCVGQAAQGKAAHAKMAQMVADCAAFCTLSAEMISRASTLMTVSCGACAEACRRCAQECATGAVDAEMKNCSEACQRCEESCRNMVRAMAAGN